MGKATSEFGAGILEGIELTDREMAIAQGDDPDAVIDDSNEVAVNDASDDGGNGDGGSGNVAPADRSDTESESAWSDDDKAAAAKYGISDEELAEFGSPKALHKAIAVLERSKQSVEPAGGVVDTPASDAAGDDATQTETKPEGIPKLDIEKLRETFGEDPETMEIIENLAKTQEYVAKVEERITRFEQQEIAREQARATETFHSMLDEYPDEFGKSLQGGKPVELSKEHESARLKVKEAAETIYAGLVAKKAQIPALSEIIEMAIKQVNGVPRKTSDRRQALVTQASLKRTPGSSAATVRKTAPPPDGSPESIASHPEIERFWREAQETNGVS